MAVIFVPRRPVWIKLRTMSYTIREWIFAVLSFDRFADSILHSDLLPTTQKLPTPLVAVAYHLLWAPSTVGSFAITSHPPHPPIYMTTPTHLSAEACHDTGGDETQMSVKHHSAMVAYRDHQWIGRPMSEP